MRAIVSNNCWGAGFYQERGREYNTPFVGMFFYPNDYLALLRDFRELMAQKLRIVEQSRYGERPWLVGLLGTVELQLMHYTSADEAVDKWERRKERLPELDADILFKICDRDGFERRHIAEFMALPFSSKVCFVKAGRFADLPTEVIEIETSDTTCPIGTHLWEITKGSPLITWPE